MKIDFYTAIDHLCRIAGCAGVWLLLMRCATAAVPEVEIANSPLNGMDSGAMIGVALSSHQVGASGAFIYQPGFNRSRWSGSLKKIAVHPDTDGSIKLATEPVWDAAEILSGHGGKGPVPPPAERRIYTSVLGIDGTLQTVEFKWVNLPEAQRVQLDTSPVSGEVDGQGEVRLEFLRGVRNRELGWPGGVLRMRDGVLGDIVHSSPVYVGAPSLQHQGAGYIKFMDAHKHRSHAVYVGANDGMLHAFDADQGRELFAYIPHALAAELSQLTRPDYMHRPYVDGAMATGEALVQGAWKTVLVAGMGGGAQGVFALDITDPAHFAEGAGALWEFSDRDDPHMGNVLNFPAIAKFRTDVVGGIPTYRYFAVVASGLNNYKADGVGRYSPGGMGALFLLSLDKSPNEKWVLNTNYYKFTTAISDVNAANGLGPAALAIGTSGEVRYAYAGDLQGNLWRFDFTGKLPWPGALSGNNPLFVAKDDGSRRQPITTQPKIVFAPGGGYVVLFGSGKFIEEADTLPGNFTPQSFYGIYDTTKKSYKVAGRDELERRKIDLEPDDLMRFTGNAFSYGDGGDTKKGWFFDFNNSDKTGERSVTNAVTAWGRVIFNSLLPCPAKCTHAGGRNYILNALTGLPVETDLTGAQVNAGTPGMPVLIELGSELGKSSAINTATTKKRYAIVHAGTDGSKSILASPAGSQSNFALTLPVRRFSWREILNWQELRHAKKK